MKTTHNPKMFRNHPLYFILTLILCPLGIGLIIMLIWWLMCKSERLIIGEESIEIQTGLLSKHQNEIFFDDIRNVQIKQTLCDRIFNVGYIGISSSGQDEIEIQIRGIHNPDAIRDFIYEHRSK